MVESWQKGERTHLVRLRICRVKRDGLRQILLAVRLRIRLEAAGRNISGLEDVEGEKRWRTHQRSVKYSSVMPTNALLALLLISPSSSSSASSPALPSKPSLVVSMTNSLACKIERALTKCSSDSCGVAESWAR